MPRPVRTHVFRGKRYNIKTVSPSSIDNDYGRCNPPDKKCKAIKINRSLRDKEELETYIHEGLHPCLWDVEESAITETASDIASLLWRLGYRKIK